MLWNLLIVLLWHVLFLETLENCFHIYVFLQIRQINDAQAWILWFGSVIMGISWCVNHLIRRCKTTFFHVILDCITILLKRAICISKKLEWGFFIVAICLYFLVAKMLFWWCKPKFNFFKLIWDSGYIPTLALNAPWRARMTVYGLYCLYCNLIVKLIIRVGQTMTLIKIRLALNSVQSCT